MTTITDIMTGCWWSSTIIRTYDKHVSNCPSYVLVRHVWPGWNIWWNKLTRNHFVQTGPMAASIVLQLLLKMITSLKIHEDGLKKSIIWKSGCVLFKLDSSAHVNPIKKGDLWDSFTTKQRIFNCTRAPSSGQIMTEHLGFKAVANI